MGDEKRTLRTLDFLVLAALAERPLHGYGIVRAIEERTGGAVKVRPGNLYRLLDRLLADELLAEGAPPESPPAPQGAERTRFFEITAAGLEAARREARMFRRVLEETPALESGETPRAAR